MRKTQAALFFHFLFTILPCFGQATEGGPSIRVLLLASGGPTMELVTLTADAAKVTGPFPVGARGLSDKVSPGAAAFAFAVEDKSTESGYRPIARVSLPTVGKDFIVLLEREGEKIVPHVVAGREPRFREGSTLFFNASDVPIGASLGGVKSVIPPRKPTILQAPAKGEKPWYQVTFYQPEEGGGSRMFANTRWPHRDSARCYVFFFRAANSGRISYQAVDETLPVAASPEAAE